MIPEHFLIKFEEKHIISIVFYNVFSTWIPTPQNPMNSNGFGTAAAAAAPAALPGVRRGRGPILGISFWALPEKVFYLDKKTDSIEVLAPQGRGIEVFVPEGQD